MQACPTSALQEHSIVEFGMPTRSVETTCAYCGVGCSFRAEVKGEGSDAEVVRMIPSKAGGANEGHSCVKGRFAYGYTSHKDRQMSPMVRESIDDEWRKVSWDEAIAKVATGFEALQAEYGVGSIGGISWSRCTNEEVYVVQKMVRAAFGNNNIDTCARVCHSPTGYGLKQTLGTSAGTQDFRSVDQADVILLIGANPTDAHPVFASRMKRRLREGAELIVADPRRIALVRSPHVEAAYHLPVLPGSITTPTAVSSNVVRIAQALHGRPSLAMTPKLFDQSAPRRGARPTRGRASRSHPSPRGDRSPPASAARRSRASARGARPCPPVAHAPAAPHRRARHRHRRHHRRRQRIADPRRIDAHRQIASPVPRAR